MSFLKRLIGNEPTVRRLMGEFEIKSEHRFGGHKIQYKAFTKITLNTYSTGEIKVEIISERQIPKFSAFSNVTPSIEARLFNLDGHPTAEEGGITKYRLADLKTKTFGIVLLISAKNAVLIFPSKLTYAYSKK